MIRVGRSRRGGAKGWGTALTLKTVDATPLSFSCALMPKEQRQSHPACLGRWNGAGPSQWVENEEGERGIGMGRPLGHEVAGGPVEGQGIGPRIRSPQKLLSPVFQGRG